MPDYNGNETQEESIIRRATAGISDVSLRQRIAQAMSHSRSSTKDYLGTDSDPWPPIFTAKAADVQSSVDGYKTMEQLLKETFGESQFRSMVGRGELHIPLKLSNDLPPTLVDSVTVTGRAPSRPEFQDFSSIEMRVAAHNAHVDKYLNDWTPYMDESRITITEEVTTTPPDIEAVASGLRALGIDRDHAYVIAYAMDSAAGSADFRSRVGSFGLNTLHNATLALKGERP